MVRTDFSNSSHVAYQIKGNGALGTIQAHILSLHSIHWTLRVRSKGQYIFKVVMMYIKLKGMKRRVLCKYTFCPYTHPRPVGWVKRSKLLFLNVAM